MIYLTSRDGCCAIVNGDVVKLEVDLHCEKKPPCFPFPVKPKQMRGDAWNQRARKVWVFEQMPAEAREEVVSYRTSACQHLSTPVSFHFQISLSRAYLCISFRPLT